MQRPIDPNLQLPTEFATNGVKADFVADKLLNGFPPVELDVLAGDNINKLIDDIYKGLNFSIEGTRAINLIQEKEVLSLIDGELTSIEMIIGANTDLSNLTESGINFMISQGFPDYSKGVSKAWGISHLAEINGFVNFYMSTSSNVVPIFEVSYNNKDWIKIGELGIPTAQASAAEFQRLIPKGLYYKGTTQGGVGTTRLTFYPAIGEV